MAEVQQLLSLMRARDRNFKIVLRDPTNQRDTKFSSKMHAPTRRGDVVPRGASQFPTTDVSQIGERFNPALAWCTKRGESLTAGLRTSTGQKDDKPTLEPFFPFSAD